MGGNVRSDDRLLDIVEALQRHTAAGVTELAETLDMPKSTVHLHLSTLKDRGYVVQNDTQEYRLSLQFLGIGTAVRETHPMYEEVMPKLKELAEETDEKAWWIVEERGKAVFAAKMTGKRGIRTNARIGQRVELHRLAAGKAILANLPDARRQAIVDGYEYPLAGDRSRADLERELGEIRERGVAYGTDEFLQGVSGVGAPLKDNDGTVYGAISVSGPTNRLTTQRGEDDLAHLVQGISGEISVNFSHN